MRHRLRSVLVGLAITAAGVTFWAHLVPSTPWDDWRLSTRGARAPAVVTDTWEETDFGDNGQRMNRYAVEYVFTLPDGRRIEGTTGSRSGRLRVSVGERFEVEYLADAPDVSRPATTGGMPLVVRVPLSLLLLGLFASPGVWYT